MKGREIYDPRLKHFPALAAELLADYGTRIDLDRLNEVDKRRLCAAMLRDDPTAITLVLPPELAPHIADLIEGCNDCASVEGDWVDLLLALRRASYPNAELERLVQGELDYLYGMRMAS